MITRKLAVRPLELCELSFPGWRMESPGNPSASEAANPAERQRRPDATIAGRRHVTTSSTAGSTPTSKAARRSAGLSARADGLRDLRLRPWHRLLLDPQLALRVPGGLRGSHERPARRERAPDQAHRIRAGPRPRAPLLLEPGRAHVDVGPSMVPIQLPPRRPYATTRPGSSATASGP